MVRTIRTLVKAYSVTGLPSFVNSNGQRQTLLNFGFRVLGLLLLDADGAAPEHIGCSSRRSILYY